MKKKKLKADTKIKRSKEVIFKEVEGVVYILDPQKSIVRTLNRTASFIWQSLEKPQSIKQLAQLLSKEFSVKEKKAKEDLEEFALQYLKDKLLTFSSRKE